MRRPESMNYCHMRMPISHGLIALFVVTGCSVNKEPSDVIDLAQRAASPRDSALFATLLDSVPTENAAVLAVRPFLTDLNGWLAGDSIMRWVARNLAGVRAETITAFRAAMADSGRADSLFGTHRDVIWISRDSSDVAPIGEHNAGILQVSRPAYSADSLQAMLYAVFRCGAHCGPAEYVLFERSPPAAGWRMRSRLRR